jgi:hypothetical protein
MSAGSLPSDGVVNHPSIAATRLDDVVMNRNLAVAADI